ncbi:hypothetical protein [Streptomyces boncukensis]|uniref:Secreted protein n=1 Tax=Streptomyces boncukensis TaxID=2711219 RepID=A0A6G4WXI0_9ACTN|nr:hypothetical protein [Streptomyces boncukensis]NGO69818.1 hypothetical protein [Streptomyces boncukensis]
MKHAGPSRSAASAQRALLRAGLLITAVGAALGAGSPGALAADDAAGSGTTTGREEAADALSGAREGLKASLGHGTREPVGAVLDTTTSLQLNPLAKTGTDPLDNSVGTQVADFPGISTSAVTGPLARGASLSELPVAGPLVNGLPG